MIKIQFHDFNYYLYIHDSKIYFQFLISPEISIGRDIRKGERKKKKEKGWKRDPLSLLTLTHIQLHYFLSDNVASFIVFISFALTVIICVFN